MLLLKHLITFTLLFSINFAHTAEDGSKCKIGERATPDQTDFLSNTFNLTLNEYPKCFQVLAGDEFIEPSMDSSFLGKEIVKMCTCEGPELDPKQKEISKKKINDLYEKELAKALKGKFYNVINQIVNVDTFIKEKNTNSSFLAKVPNCQFNYIFDELKKAREKEGCDKDSFDKRMELAFGTKDTEEARKKLTDQVSPIMQNKTKEGSCLPYKTYVRISSKEGFSYDTTYLYRDELDRGTVKDNRLEFGKSKRNHSRLALHLANLKGEAPALNPNSDDITLNDILSAAEKTSSSGGIYVHTISKMIEAQKEKNPLLKAVLSNKESANKFVEIALSKLCSPDKVQPGEECSFKTWEDIVDSQENIEDILLSDENLESLGETLNNECSSLAGFSSDFYRDRDEANNIQTSIELEFLCKAEIPKPSFETFKNGLLPALAKEAPTGDLVFHGMEYAKSEYCNYKPEKGYSIKPITSRNKIESYFQPASREVSEIEKMQDKKRLEQSPYEKMDKLTCEIVNKSCKEANKADCFKNEKLASILASVNPDDYFDSEDPTTFGNNVFLEGLKSKVTELAKGNERVPQANGDDDTTLAGNLLGGGATTETTDELFAPETGQNSTDSTVTSYLAHGTSEDRDTVIEHRRRIQSGEIPANTPISIPRRGFDPPASNGGVIADGGTVDNGTTIPDQVEQDIDRSDSNDSGINDSSIPVADNGSSLKPVFASNDDATSIDSTKERDGTENTNTTPTSFNDDLSPVYTNQELEPSETISYKDPNEEALKTLAELRKALGDEERKNYEILGDIDRERTFAKGQRMYREAVDGYNSDRDPGGTISSRSPGSVGNSSKGRFSSELNSKIENIQEFAENGFTKDGKVPYGYGNKASVSTSSKKRRRGAKVKGKGTYYSTDPMLSASAKEIDGYITENGLKLKIGENFKSLRNYSENIGQAYEFNNPDEWSFGRVIPHPIIQNRSLEDVIRQYGLEGKKFHSLHIDPKGVKDRKVILITFDFPKGYFDESQGTPEYDEKRKQVMGAIAYSRSEFSGKSVLKRIRNTTVEVSRVDLTGKKLPKNMKEIKLFAFKNLMLESETMNNAIMVDLINMSAFRIGME